MSNILGGLDFDRWYIVWITVSLVVLVACIAAQEDRWALIAVGSLLFGMGELKNHPRRQTVFLDRSILTNRSRRNSLFGLFLDLVGVALISYGAAWSAGFV